MFVDSSINDCYRHTSKFVISRRYPEGRVGHGDGGEETDTGGLFRVPRRGSVQRREDGERCTSKSAGRSERVERAVEGVMSDRRISIRLKGKVMNTCVTPECLYRTETLAMTELQQHGRQVCENNWVQTNSKSNEGRQEKNCGVKGRDGSAEELDRETGDEQATVGRTRRKEGGCQTTEESGRVT